jgi:alkylation response protein AidB-like acyl-CoA dehydrogenase
MDLALTTEQEEIRRLARDFAEREVKPRAEAIDHRVEFPRDLVEKAAALCRDLGRDVASVAAARAQLGLESSPRPAPNLGRSGRSA